jgi:hypothetical protein
VGRNLALGRGNGTGGCINLSGRDRVKRDELGWDRAEREIRALEILQNLVI